MSKAREAAARAHQGQMGILGGDPVNATIDAFLGALSEDGDLVERVAKAIDDAKKLAEKSYFLHGTENPEIWTLRQRYDGAELVLSSGDMATQIIAMNTAMRREEARAAIAAMLAQEVKP